MMGAGDGRVCPDGDRADSACGAWPESRSNGLFRWSPRIFSSLIGRGDMCCHEAPEKSEVEPEVIEE